MKLRVKHLLPLFLLLAAPQVIAAPKAITLTPEHPPERILPLGPAEVSELSGVAWVSPGPPAGPTAPRRPLHKGERVASGQRIETGPGADCRLELRFADGSLLRLGLGATVTLLSDTRQVALHRGRILIAADRMLGSIAVLTRRLSFLPEGTTYVVELDEKDPRLELTVLEGAVWACPVVSAPAGNSPSATSPAPTVGDTPLRNPDKTLIVLPGERMEWKTGDGPLRPQPESLTDRMKLEPLIAGFGGKLPTWLRIDDLADQQRRHFLAGRNERLRREIFWKRPPLPPVKLPPLFAEPDSIIIRYVFPP